MWWDLGHCFPYTILSLLIFLQYSAQVLSNSLIFNKGALEMNLIGEVMEDHSLDGIIKPVPCHYFLNMNSTVKPVLSRRS